MQQTFIFTGGGRCFGAAGHHRGSVATRRLARRHWRCLVKARLIDLLARLYGHIARCLDALARLCAAVRLPVVASDTDWCAGEGSGYAQEAALRWQPTAKIDTAPLVKAAIAQEKTAMVVHYPTAAASPATPLVTQQPAVTTFWAGRSPTPGLANTISLKDSAAKLSAARQAGSCHLIDPARVRTQRA